MALSDFLEQPKDAPPIITIVGDAGTGKTLLASKFNKPVFILAENGLASIKNKPAALKQLVKGSDIFDQLTALVKEDHGFKTVVIDSVTKLNAMFEKEIVDADPKAKSINQANGGYGAGVQAVAEMHWRVKRAADILVKKGVAVVFIAHADTERVDLPDVDPYTRYTIRMHRHSVSPYTDDVDMVGYLHRKIFSLDGKPVDTGKIVFTCQGSASRISKNRFGITQEIEVGLDTPITEITKFIPFFNNNKGEAK